MARRRDGLGELRVILAGLTAALLDLAELHVGTRHVAFGDEGLAHVLTRQGVVGIDAERPLVKGHGCIDVAELACGETRDAQNARIVFIVGLFE